MLTKEEILRRGYVKYKGKIYPLEGIRDGIDEGEQVPHVFFIDVQTGIRIDHPDLSLPTVDEVLEYKRKQLN